jgi:hypothetical protein
LRTYDEELWRLIEHHTARNQLEGLQIETPS